MMDVNLLKLPPDPYTRGVNAVRTRLAADGRRGLDLDSIEPKDGHHLLALPYRVRTPQQADELRLDYLRLFAAYMKYTAKSDRHCLLDLDHTVENGVYRYEVEGLVADCDETSVSDGHISRICLMLPHVGDTVFDSHIWLATFVKNTIIRPDLIRPRNGNGNRLMTIRLGDTLRLTGTLNAYTDKAGRHRFGLADWTPLDSRLRYVQHYADGRNMEREVPETSCGSDFDVCRLDSDDLRLRSPLLEDVRATLDEAWAHYNRGGRVFLTDGDGRPSVCFGLKTPDGLALSYKGRKWVD